MKYYLIVGEASGDLHASNLMKALQDLFYDTLYIRESGRKICIFRMITKRKTD